MKALFIIIVCATLFFSSFGHAATLVLSDFSGQKGPAPPPAPYATTTLSINDSTAPIDSFSIDIYWEGSALQLHQTTINNAIFGKWDFTKVYSVSGNGFTYLTLTGWTLGSPIPTGFSGDLAQITFEVADEQQAVLTLRNGQYDFDGILTKDATFTPGQGEVIQPFLPHVDGDANLNGKLDLPDALIILRTLSAQ